jgi:hypothetical protein
MRRLIQRSTRTRAEDLLTLALTLTTRLPGTRAALRDGIIRLDKAQIIAAATANLDPDEARQAEALVLGRAGRLTSSRAAGRDRPRGHRRRPRQGQEAA